MNFQLLKILKKLLKKGKINYLFVKQWGYNYVQFTDFYG